MQLIADALSVLGSRHGLVMDPVHRKCGIVRFDRWDALPTLHLRAGALIEGREVVFPLCPQGDTFRFLDQRLTPCTMTLIGMDAKSGTKVKLTIATPFRPRDAAFSTTPVIGLRLEAEPIAGGFRWEGKGSRPAEIELFLEFAGPQLVAEPSDSDAVDLCFNSLRSSTETGGTRAKPMTEVWPQRDRLVAISGCRLGTAIRQTVRLAEPVAIEAAWCTHSAPNLTVQGDRCPDEVLNLLRGRKGDISRYHQHALRLGKGVQSGQHIAGEASLGRYTSLGGRRPACRIGRLISYQGKFAYRGSPS